MHAIFAVHPTVGLTQALRAIGKSLLARGPSIDIDPYVNGWLWDNNHGTHPSINKHLELASRLFGGRAFTSSTLDARSNEISTEELHGEVSQASSAFGRG